MSDFNFTEYIENNTLRVEASYRGGGIEISLDDYLLGLPEGSKMTAYQNYLGGGMLGSIQSDCNIRDWQNEPDLAEPLAKMADALKRYFHGLTDHADDEWEHADFEATQNRPGSAY